MNITLDGYTVKELANDWKVEYTTGKVSLTIKVPKTLCATVEELKAYLESDAFGGKANG